MPQDKQPGADGPQAGSGDYAGTPRPDAVMPTLDEGQLPAIETTRAETPLTPGARFSQAMRRLLEGAPLDASALAVERMRKLVALPVLSADALSSVAHGPEAMLAVLVLAGDPLSESRLSR